jgi:glycosyltransferase-like protein
MSAAHPRSIGLFTYSTVPRGSVVHTANLADALHAAGCDVTVYALDKERRGFFRPLRAPLVLVPASPTPATTAELVRTRAQELAALLARLAPAHDVFHAEDCLTANGLLQYRGALPAAQASAFRLVRTVHHVEAFTDGFLADCQRRSILGASLCLTVSQATARDVQRQFGVRTLPVANGVHVERFSRVDPRRLAAWTQKMYAGSGPVVLAVGGVEERKNTLGVLRAFARVREQYPTARLWILGGATVLDHGAYRAAFEQELAGRSSSFGSTVRTSLRAAVTEIGVVDDEDVPAIFRLASVLAFPSLHEGFGLVALEALAARLPLVASRRAPLTEFLDDSCAVLVDPESDADIAHGIVEALRKSSRARSDAGELRARAHSWSRVAALHLEHYRGLGAPRIAEVHHA